MRKLLEKNKNKIIDKNLLKEAKIMGFSDYQISKYICSTENAIRNLRNQYNIIKSIKQIDTVAGEFPCYTNYLYSTYHTDNNDIEFIKNNNKSIIILGSGVYKIGSSVEFDWCTVNCIRRIRELGYKAIVINCNPETVSTDYDEADRLYFDELNFESVMDIYELENPMGIILSMGGQIPNNIAMSLHRKKVKIIGTNAEMIDYAENRYKFSRVLDNLDIDQPKWKELNSIEEAINFCHNVEYPCLIRPSYVLSGAAMNVAFNDKDLKEYLLNAKDVSKEHPVVISKFIMDAKEIEVDAVAKKGEIKLYAISEHVENAGIHSGDATLILPAQDLTKNTTNKIKEIMHKIAKELMIDGPFNIQFIAKNDEIKVIECNLRVSRSFPFVSKTLGINFAKYATDILLNIQINNIKYLHKKNFVGVKVPKFSFDRLDGADTILGVEMMSTGEVACFGENHYEAYIKSLISTGFKLPKKGGKIFISIGSYKQKREFLESIKNLENMGFQLHGSKGTADFYNEYGINIKTIIHDKIDNKTIINYYKKYNFDLIINISIIGNKINNNTYGYWIRRIATDFGIPLITDIKCAKLFIQAFLKYSDHNLISVRTYIDSQTSYKTIKLPGLINIYSQNFIDIHSNNSDIKETSEILLKSGITSFFSHIYNINNINNINDNKYDNIIKSFYEKNSIINFSIYSIANNNNIHKLNENNNINSLLIIGENGINDNNIWIQHIKNWKSSQPLCVIAKTEFIFSIIHIAHIYNKKIHFCYISKKEEIEIIKESKKQGYNITCSIDPNYLFILSDQNKNKNISNHINLEDINAIWENLEFIDCFSLYSYNNNKEIKYNNQYILSKLLTLVSEDKLSIKDIITKFHDNPINIFNLKLQSLNKTYIEVDLDKEWEIDDKIFFFFIYKYK
jgi:carbamoyl-phosphate synthase/aspartate carbamoyltransferase/dihydroorotase